MITWREIVTFLSTLDDDQLDDTATVWDVEQGEFYACDFLELQDGDDILDDGHLFIAIKQD